METMPCTRPYRIESRLTDGGKCEYLRNFKLNQPSWCNKISLLFKSLGISKISE